MIADSLWIAYSGGLDSHVLLDMCYAARDELPKINVVHVHHGLSPNADAWALHCETICRDLNLNFHCVRLNLQLDVGDSLEEAARDARYQIFADFLQENDLLLTAHHQDDQAETVLLQLMRGAGPKGLSAMPALKTFAKGFHGRPLLTYTRKELLEYARTRQLVWIEDESNNDLSFTRNFIRQKMMPMLATKQPAIVKTIARSAEHCAETQLLLTEVALQKLANMQGSRNETLSVTKLKQESAPWQRLLLRTFIEQQGFLLPDADKLNNILTTVLTAAHDKMPLVAWHETELRRYGDDIYVLKAISNELDLQDYLQNLRIEKEKVTVRYRQPGESVTLSARGKITLKNLFQEWRVPTWERGRLPLVFCEDTLILVPGYYSDTAYFF